MADISAPIAKLTEVINSGKFDEALDILAIAIKRRQAVVLSELASQLEPGDEVVLSSSLRPKYVQGLRATVVRFETMGRGSTKRKMVWVTIIPIQQGRLAGKKFGPTFAVPLDTVSLRKKKEA